MMKILKIIFLLTISVSLFSCGWFEEKAKHTINKSGEIASRTGSEFVNGIEKGIEKTFKSEIVLSQNLKNLGIEVGKVTINNSEGATDNVLTIYLIFKKDFNQNIQVKVFDDENKEYGRTSQIITAKANEAKYFDFTFDNRTNIDGKGKVTLE